MAFFYQLGSTWANGRRIQYYMFGIDHSSCIGLITYDNTLQEGLQHYER